MKREFLVLPSEDGLTAGDILRQRGVSRRFITKLKRIPLGITKNSLPCRTVDRAYTSDTIAISCDDEIFLVPNGELYSPIIFENESVVVFNKPGDMPVHPSLKHYSDTLGNLFSHLHPDLTFRPINRLDRGTSGCLAVCKDRFAASLLQKNLQKVYFAVCEGECEKSGRIELNIRRADQSIILREVHPSGQTAVTNYQRLVTNGSVSLVKILLETGRTHQIRVHFKAIGHPLVGDTLYGSPSPLISRQALHCGSLSFINPTNNEKIECYAPFTEDFSSLLRLEGLISESDIKGDTNEPY